MTIAFTPAGTLRRPFRPFGAAVAYLLTALVGVAIGSGEMGERDGSSRGDVE